MFNSILVVCVGNICRSPIGERLLKKMYPGKQIDSAGISALIGHPADPMSVAVSEEKGISLDNHYAKQLTRSLCLDHDLILVMEYWHIDNICRKFPEARGKVMLFGHWINKQEIPDPYRKDKKAFENAFALLEKSAYQWSDVL